MDLKACGSCGKTFAKEEDILRHSGGWRVCKNDLFWFTCECGSTLILTQGEVDWFSPDYLGRVKKNDSLNMLMNQDRFPRLPAAALEIQGIIADESSTASQIAKVAKLDPMISAGILLIANNMKHESGSRITSLEHAVTYIGREAVKAIVFTAAVGSLKLSTEVFNAQQFWQEAFLTGSIAENLAASLSKVASPDESYIAGCLCNLGKFVNAIYLPDLVDEICSRTLSDRTEKSTWAQEESRVTLLTHDKVGEYAAGQWGLPSFVVRASATHHDHPAGDIDRSQDGLSLNELVALANQLMLIVRGRIDRIDGPLVLAYQEICAISDDDLDMLVSDLVATRERADELVNSLFSKSI